MVVNNAGLGAGSGPTESQENQAWQWAMGN
jgi:NADP-dependent 3-hydroxy acid dehydrogenase YdfG